MSTNAANSASSIRIALVAIACCAIACFLGNRTAQAANLLSPTVPVTTILTVQPIVVCQGSGTVSSTPGTGCAPSSGLGTYETYTNAIYDQAGIGVAFAPPEYLDNSAYLKPDVETTTASVFDTAHNLVRLAGNGQSTDPDTLNVYLVDNLISTTNGVPNGTGVYGYGLIGGNGAIIATAPDAKGRQAAVDTMAHELDHNLGLTHVDQSPYVGTAVDTAYNLMNTGSRVVPFETCQVAPYNCAPPKGDMVAASATAAASTSGTTTLTMASATKVLPGMVATGTGIPVDDTVMSVVGNTVTLATPVSGTVALGAKVGFASPPETDQLIGPTSPANQVAIDNQVATMRAPPIFTEMPNVQDTNADISSLFTGVAPGTVAEQQYNYVAPPPVMNEIKWRFTKGATVPDTCYDYPVPAGGCGTTGLTSAVIGSHVEWDYNLVAAGVPPAAAFSTAFCCSSGAYSTEFDFANGIASRAGFDLTGNAYSQNGAVFTFDPTAPGLPIGPSYLPTDFTDISPVTGQLVGEDTDAQWSTPANVNGAALPFAALDATAAPEPASLLLLGAAIGGLMAIRRRRVPL